MRTAGGKRLYGVTRSISYVCAAHLRQERGDNAKTVPLRDRGKRITTLLTPETVISTVFSGMRQIDNERFSRVQNITLNTLENAAHGIVRQRTHRPQAILFPYLFGAGKNGRARQRPVDDFRSRAPGQQPS